MNLSASETCKYIYLYVLYVTYYFHTPVSFYFVLTVLFHSYLQFHVYFFIFYFLFLISCFGTAERKRQLGKNYFAISSQDWLSIHTRESAPPWGRHLIQLLVPKNFVGTYGSLQCYHVFSEYASYSLRAQQMSASKSSDILLLKSY